MSSNKTDNAIMNNGSIDRRILLTPSQTRSHSTPYGPPISLDQAHTVIQAAAEPRSGIGK